MESSDLEELKAYRERVISELERRMLVLQEIDRRLSQAQHVLDIALKDSRSLRGNTARIQVQGAHRAKLRSDLKAIERERFEAKVDLERAEARLRDVDMRLDELEAKGREEEEKV